MDGFIQDAAQTPDLLVLFNFFYSLDSIPGRRGKRGAWEWQRSDLCGENTKDAEGTGYPPSLVPGLLHDEDAKRACGRNFPKPRPPRCRSRPGTCWGATPQPRPPPPPSAPRPPGWVPERGCRVWCVGRPLGAPAYVWERTWEARPSRARGPRCLLSSVTCRALMPGFSSVWFCFSGWRGAWVREWNLMCCCSAVSRIRKQTLCGVKLSFVEPKSTCSLLTDWSLLDCATV